ncbi:MAG: Uma2 family endonuclease, partial [Moorea sp. SIO3E2]|nr:Uma2 family endonuclease [Moorena sp. SIO3E2]
ATLEGIVLPTPEENAAIAQEQAAIAQEQAAIAQERAEKLAARLRAMGVNPDQV